MQSKVIFLRVLLYSSMLWASRIVNVTVMVCLLCKGTSRITFMYFIWSCLSCTQVKSRCRSQPSSITRSGCKKLLIPLCSHFPAIWVVFCYHLASMLSYLQKISLQYLHVLSMWGWRKSSLVCLLRVAGSSELLVSLPWPHQVQREYEASADFCSAVFTKQHSTSKILVGPNVLPYWCVTSKLFIFTIDEIIKNSFISPSSKIVSPVRHCFLWCLVGLWQAYSMPDSIHSPDLN